MILSFYLIVNTKKAGFATSFCIFLGCTTIIAGLLMTNDVYYVDKTPYRFNVVAETIAQRMQNIESAREILHLYSLFIGASSVCLGLIFAYRPSIIQVKNHLPFEYPYPIWHSKNQPMTKFNASLISIKEFLTDKERLLSCRFKYLLVSIGGDLYLVSPNEKIPHDSIVIRTKSNKTLCGISRFR